MAKSPKTPGKPMHEIIAIRTFPEFKTEVIELSAKAGYENYSDYIRDAIEQKNILTREQHA